MSADGDMVRTIEGLVKVVKKACDNIEDFDVQIELWKSATRYIELANKERIGWLWGSVASGLTAAEQAEYNNLGDQFWPDEKCPCQLKGQRLHDADCYRSWTNAFIEKDEES